jgi:glycine/D-amino acid oxidase-like deaminating enzyme
MADVLETLIIGGGISGLGCARQLCDAGRPFLLVTDRLGGRMHHSPDGTMNFGACYITADYRHIQRYVRRGYRFRLRDAWAQGRDGRMTSLFEWRNLRLAGPLLGLVLRLRELRAVMQRFRRDAEHTAQKDLLPRYPLFQRYIRQPAGELIEELGLGELHERYFKPTFLTTCFTDPLAGNALFYLGVLLPLIIPTWVADFTNSYDLLTAGYQECIAIDRVVHLARAGDRWEIGSAAGKAYQARNVVLAVPYHNARALYPVPAPKLVTSATVIHARGRRRPPFRGKRFVLMPPEKTGMTLVWQQRAGNDLIYSLRPQPDLAAVYEAAEVAASVTWKTAIVLSGADWVPLRLEPNLYLVGDYNLCGLEDSLITGLCAANHIIDAAWT